MKSQLAILSSQSALQPSAPASQQRCAVAARYNKLHATSEVAVNFRFQCLAARQRKDALLS